VARATARPVQAPKRRGATRERRLSGRRLWLAVGGAAVVAVGVAAALIAVSLSGGKSEPRAATVTGGPATAALFEGIPQRGIFLGSPTAPVTLIEFADLQCPYCAQWAEDSLPTVVRRYVRTGKVRLEFRGIAFIGPDSSTALNTVVAAASQNKLWNVLDLFYRNQGAENSGWVTEPLTRGILAAVPGLDVDRVLADRSSNAVADQILAARQRSLEAGVDSTPSFQIARRGEAPHRVELTSLEPSGITKALDAALAG
jgi:protein-disulfide isomerase